MDIRPYEIKNFFKGKNKGVTANEFMKTLFKSRDTVNLKFYKTLVDLKEWLRHNTLYYREKNKDV